MPENDGLDDALRSATQTVASLLARRAQQWAISREQQSRQRRFELDRANAKLTAERAITSLRGPQFTIQHGTGEAAARQEINRQEALDRINWTEEDRHQFEGRVIRGTDVDIMSWIGLDADVDAAIAERYPQLMTREQRAGVRNALLAHDPAAFVMSVGDRDIRIDKATALDVLSQPELQDFQRSAIPSWIGRDREIDRAIHRNHPDLMSPAQLLLHETSERKLADALDTVRSAEADLEEIRDLVGRDPEIDWAIYERFPQALPPVILRQQIIQELYPAEPVLAAAHHTQDALCERNFTQQQALDRIDDSAGMLAAGGYFDQLQETRGVAAQVERAEFAAQRAEEFSEWIGQDPDVDQHLFGVQPGLFTDDQVAQLRILDGLPRYPEEPGFTIRRGEVATAPLNEQEAIGVVERRAATLGFIEAGPAKNELVAEIRGMIGQSPAVDRAIDQHFPDLLDRAARVNLRLAQPGWTAIDPEKPSTETIIAMREAEARALYPSDRHALKDMVQGLPTNAAIYGDIRSAGALQAYAGQSLDVDRLIYQHQPDALSAAQLSRMRAAEALLDADAEFNHGREHLEFGVDNQQAADLRRSSGERLEPPTDHIDVDPEPVLRTDAGASLESDADRNWDSAEERAARARSYEACGHAEAAEARTLADTAQAQPPRKALDGPRTSRIRVGLTSSRARQDRERGK